MERLKQKFLDEGLTAADIPTAIVLHEVVSIAMAAASWIACYAIQPSRTLVAGGSRAAAGAATHAKLQQAYSRAMVQAQNTIQRQQWMKRLPGVGANSGRVTVALAESIAIRAALKPLTIPFKIWAAYKLTLATKRRPAGDDKGKAAPKKQR